MAEIKSMAKAAMPWATVDPYTLSGKNPVQLYNLLGGKWVLAKKSVALVDPLNGEEFLLMPDTSVGELEPFVQSLNSCPKSGLHNIFKNPERYVHYGALSLKLAVELGRPEVEDFFVKLIQRVCPKHIDQARGEVTVVRAFLENFSGDNVRFLARGFVSPGNHVGQRSVGYRWPMGPVCIISPFNFPLEIPILQLMGALYMGNKVTLKSATTTTVVAEQFLRLMEHCGAHMADFDYLNCGGRVAGEFNLRAKPRLLQFTGSSGVAETLTKVVNGRIRIEDAGFDWKILGPDVHKLDYVAWQCDQDAYAASGQKCSAQSILFVHENWAKAGIYDALAKRAAQRNLADLSVGPVLTHTTADIAGHVQKLEQIVGAKVLFGGRELTKHTIPKVYGAFEPTAVFVPLEEAAKVVNFEHVTREIFGPFQVVTEYTDAQLPVVLEMLERMEAHLTAAVVSNDVPFVQHIMAHTVNGTSYSGCRARTTGAPQNHWFGPAGDPRGAGIGTAEAIRLVWSCHREIVEDFGPIPDTWTAPKPS